MSSEYSVTGRSFSETEQSTRDLEQPYMLARAAAFLEQSSGVKEHLGCTDCVTKMLCASVIQPLIERNEDKRIEQNDVPTLQGHGIEVASNGYSVCPGRLVTTAVRRELAGDFWIATNDPLNDAAPHLRIAEALRLATQSLVELLDKDIRI